MPHHKVLLGNAFVDVEYGIIYLVMRQVIEHLNYFSHCLAKVVEKILMSTAW